MDFSSLGELGTSGACSSTHFIPFVLSDVRPRPLFLYSRMPLMRNSGDIAGDLSKGTLISILVTSLPMIEEVFVLIPINLLAPRQCLCTSANCTRLKLSRHSWVTHLIDICKSVLLISFPLLVWSCDASAEK